MLPELIFLFPGIADELCSLFEGLALAARRLGDEDAPMGGMDDLPIDEGLALACGGLLPDVSKFVATCLTANVGEEARILLDDLPDEFDPAMVCELGSAEPLLEVILARGTEAAETPLDDIANERDDVRWLSMDSTDEATDCGGRI